MNTYPAKEIITGYHPNGFRIDKTASPIDRYTQWHIDTDGRWGHKKPVCFHSVPADGWFKVDTFDWDDVKK